MGVQERACCIIQLMKYIQKLQDKGVNDPPSESSDEEYQPSGFGLGQQDEYKSSYYNNDKKAAAYEPTEAELQQRRDQRISDQMHNPHYLKGETKNKMGLSDSFVHIDDVPIVTLDNA